MRLTIIYAAVSLAVILVYNGVVLSSQYLAGSEFRKKMLGDDVPIAVLAPASNVNLPLHFWVDKAFRQYERDIQERLFAIDAFIIVCTIVVGYSLNRYLLKPIRRFASEQEEFIANASHEIKTPLTTIRAELAAIGQIKSRRKDEERESLAVIETEVRTLSNLVVNLLTLSTLDQNEIKIKTEVNSVIKKKIVTLRKNLQEKKLKINFEAREEIFYQVNPVYVKQLLDILLDNAIKYATPKTVIGVKLARHKDWLILQVSNRGVVIEEAAREKIFERFYRVTNRATMEQSGSGLGLAIAKTLAEKMNGSVELTRSDAQETVFTVHLPL
jgi:signal transduction histidine kinase